MSLYKYWKKRFEKMGNRYVGHVSMDDQQVEDQMRFFWSNICPHIGSTSGTVLDFGCGYGRLYPYLNCDCYLGVDILDAFEDVEDNQVSVLADEAGERHWGLDPDSADTLFAISVFEYIVDDIYLDNHCKQIRKICKTGADVFIIDSVEGTEKHMKPRSVIDLQSRLSMELNTLETIKQGRFQHQLIHGTMI